MDLVRCSIAQQKHPVQLRQLGTEVFVLLERDLDAALHLADGLRRGIHDLVLIEGEKLGVGGRVTGKGEREASGSRSEDGLGRGRQRLRQKAAEAIEERLPARIGGPFLRRNLQREGQVGLARNANLAAHQPIDMGRRAGRWRAPSSVESALRVMGKSTSSS